MNDANETYQIPEENIDSLKERLDKLVRKSQKLGLAEIAYIVGQAYDVPYLSDTKFEVNNGKYGWPQSLAEAEMVRGFHYRRFYSVQVTGEAPRLSGWTFGATLQHLTDEEGKTINLLRTAPSFKLTLPEKYRTADASNCDHCHKVIKTRKDTFIVYSETENKWMQVGRSCLADFIGGVDPKAVAAALECLLSAMDTASESEGDWSGGFAGQARTSMRAFLTQVAAVVRIDGWVSRGKARDLYDNVSRSTASIAYECLNPPPASNANAYEYWKELAAHFAPNETDKEVAEKAMAYARETLAEKDDRSDYEHNLYVATVQASVDHRLTGIAASLIAYYLKEVERQILREAELKRAGNSQYVGTVGEKVLLTVQVVKILEIEGQYGTTRLHKMVDNAGNMLTWFASSGHLEIGRDYKVKAGVKKHEEYQGAKQTILTRVTVLDDAKWAKEMKKAAKK